MPRREVVHDAARTASFVLRLLHLFEGGGECSNLLFKVGGLLRLHLELINLPLLVVELGFDSLHAFHEDGNVKRLTGINSPQNRIFLLRFPACGSALAVLLVTCRKMFPVRQE